MLTFGLVLRTALQDGLVLSGLLSILIVGSLALNPEMWLNDYPPDIREKFGPMSDKARRQRIPVGVLFSLIVAAVIGVGMVRLSGAVHEKISFGWAFLYVYLLLLVFNLFDLLILDWLLFVNLLSNRVVLPGTEGLPGYSDYRFHFRGFLVGLLFGGVGALVAALLTVGAQVLFRF